MDTLQNTGQSFSGTGPYSNPNPNLIPTQALTLNPTHPNLTLEAYSKHQSPCTIGLQGNPSEVGALFTKVSSIRVNRVRVTVTVTVGVSRVSVMVSVRDSIK